MQIEYIVVLLLAVAVLYGVAGGKRTRRRRQPAENRSSPSFGSPLAKLRKVGALERAQNGNFTKRRVFNSSELKIFRILDEEGRKSQRPMHIMGQVSMRAMVETDSRFVKDGSWFALTDRHVDFIAVDQESNVVAAIEHHGAGHYQNNAAERDEVKEVALRKAGIPLLIIGVNEAESSIRARFNEVIARPA